jgi:hypothetical protein
MKKLPAKRIGGVKGNKEAHYLKVADLLALAAGGRQRLYDSLRNGMEGLALLWCPECKDIVEQRRIQASSYLCARLHVNLAPENIVATHGKRRNYGVKK